ncbi:MmgE/PrpD family protein [Chloroflexota bacterium]
MFTEELARYGTRLTYGQLPDKVIDTAKIAILDCLGVTVAGCQEIPSRIISEYVSGSAKAEAGVIGSGFKTAADQAAWANGTSGHALDYDDYFSMENSIPYHPTVVLLPAILAAGEKYHLSGRDVLLAYITGFEAQATLAKACAKPQYDLGWHPTSTLGSLGAAAAVAKMLRLDEVTTRMALGIAASLCGGIRKNFGTMTKPLHAGNAARNGVIAAELAQKGFTADDGILDKPLSFCDILAGEAVNTEWQSEAGFYIISPGIAIKPYPSCAYTHWAIDAALALRREAGVNPGSIVEVQCRTSSGLPRLLIHSRPTTALEGKFSLEYCVAIALIEGGISLTQFTDDKVRQTVVQGLIKKVKYVHPAEMGSGLENLRGEVAVRLQNGEVHSRRIDMAKGDPRNPLSWNELEKKYRDCVQPFLSAADTERSISLVSHLETVGDISELMDILIEAKP